MIVYSVVQVEESSKYLDVLLSKPSLGDKHKVILAVLGGDGSLAQTITGFYRRSEIF